MQFIANYSSTGNMQIDLMVIQSISQSNESLIRPLENWLKSLLGCERTDAKMMSCCLKAFKSVCKFYMLVFSKHTQINS